MAQNFITKKTMTYTEDIIRTLKWSVEALQKENDRLNNQIEQMKIDYERELENALIKQRLEIQKDQILENYE